MFDGISEHSCYFQELFCYFIFTACMDNYGMFK